MPRVFINFRTSDRIFDCVLYSRELAPVLLDEGNAKMKLLFHVESYCFDKNNSHISESQEKGVLGCSEIEKCQTVQLCSSASSSSLLLPNSTSNSCELPSQTCSRYEDENMILLQTVLVCVLAAKRCGVFMDSHLASCVACELNRSRKFRRRFLKYLAKNHGFKSRVEDHYDLDFSEVDCHRYLEIPYMVDIVTLWSKQKIDYAWFWRIEFLLGKKITSEVGMAWLSTLGGGYSSLGDYFKSHAALAGQISIKQLKIALEMGDPITVSKCCVFWAQSLLQRGYLRESRNIIRREYQFAVQHVVRDSKLENMCQSLWKRLQYLYQSRKGKKLHGRNAEKLVCNS